MRTTVPRRCCVTADLTVTMAAVKTGMLVGKGPNASGRIVVARIGIPDRCLEEAGGDYELFTRQDARNLLRREPFNTYKNRRGHLGTWGGSSDYGSAAVSLRRGRAPDRRGGSSPF